MNLKKITLVATILVAFFTAPSLWAIGGPSWEYWSGIGTITASAAADLGFAPFHEWSFEIIVDNTQYNGQIADGKWEDVLGHTGTITGYVGSDTGYGSWDCDQHPESGTWAGTFDREEVGDSCYCQWYYWRGTGGGFQGIRTQ